MHKKHKKHSTYDIYAIFIDSAIALQMRKMRMQESMQKT